MTPCPSTSTVYLSRVFLSRGTEAGQEAGGEDTGRWQRVVSEMNKHNTLKVVMDNM